MRSCIQHFPAVAVSKTEILPNSARYINSAQYIDKHIKNLLLLLNYFHLTACLNAWSAHTIDRPFATSLQKRYNIDCKWFCLVTWTALYFT